MSNRNNTTTSKTRTDKSGEAENGCLYFSDTNTGDRGLFLPLLQVLRASEISATSYCLVGTFAYKKKTTIKQRSPECHLFFQTTNLN